MRRFFWLLLCLAVPSAAVAQTKTEAPILVVESGGHTALVRKVMFTKDDREVISVSQDKTIRIWYVETGELLSVIRTPIARGNEGMHYTATLSPDGRFLAVAGNGSSNGLAAEKMGTIYILPVAYLGKTQKVLRGHTSAVNAVAFSPNGKYLASAGSDVTVRIWDITSGKTVQTMKGHKITITGVAFSPDGKHVATSSFDQTAQIWSVATGKSEATLRGHDKELDCVAWSPDGKTIATSGKDESLCLFDAKGILRKRVTGLGSEIKSVAFTPDSKQVLITRFGVQPTCSLIDVESGKEAVKFTGHTNTVMTGALSSDGKLAATAGASDDGILLWRTEDGKQLNRLSGKGKSVWACGWSKDGNYIAWGTRNQGTSFENEPPLMRTFHLSELEFGPPPDKTFRRAQLRDNLFTLERTDNRTLTVEQKPKPLTIKVNEYDRVGCATMLPGNRIVMGSWFGLWLHDARTGKQTRTYLGHTDNLWCVAPSPDDRLFASGSSDQTVRIWDPAKSDPLLSLFFAGNDWIAWTPEGYYAASPGGEKLMGWHVNGTARDAMPSYYPAAQFRKTLYRPDVIKEVISAGSVKVALARADKARGKAGGDVADVAKVLPPKAVITSPEAAAKLARAEVTVQATATSAGRHPVTALRLLLDGRAVGEPKKVAEPKVGGVKESWTVKLTPGRHRLVVLVDSEVSQGASEEVEVVYTGAGEPEEKPRLFVLAVGISGYPNERRLNYAARDAEAVADAFKEKSRPLFRQVEVKLLIDGQAKRADILKGLGAVKEEATAKDYTVVFLSGHAQLDGDKKFTFLPSDIDPKTLTAGGISGAELKKALLAIPGRVVLILDTSRPGDVKAASVTDDLLRDLVSDENGVVVMCSTTGKEVSAESADHKSSLFTAALLEGMSGKAAPSASGIVYFHQLERYVSERVKELSKDQQHPVISKPSTIRTFPLTQP